METKQKLIRMLADGKFHSGETLAGLCGISRTAIWKHIAQIQEQFGLQIHAVRGRGYQLSVQLDLLDTELIVNHIKPEIREQVPLVEVKNQIESTNSYLLSCASMGVDSGRVCLAERQTSGRGRRGRKWVSPYGNNIYLSIYKELKLGLSEIGGVSLSCGIAVVRTLERLGFDAIGLKWPNDILYNGKKLAGLLIEVTGEQAGPAAIVIGLGLNCRLNKNDASEIDQPWSALSDHPMGRKLSRNVLAARLIEGLILEINRFELHGFQQAIKQWNRLDVYQGSSVVLTAGSNRIIGLHQGVNNQGALLLKTKDGIRAFHGGEISLRPTNQYEVE